MKKNFFLIGLFCVAGIAVAAQKNTFTVTSDKQRIVIGEPFQLVLKVSVSKNQKSKWVAIDTLPHFEILHRSKMDTLANGKGIIWQQTLTLTSWDSGRWQIPALMFGGKKSAPIPITVAFSPFNRAQDYHDIKEIFEVQKQPRTVWYWYVLLLILLAGLLSLIFPTNKKPTATEVKRDETIFKKTMLRLDALKIKATTEDSKVFYTEMIAIFRNYLIGRKGIQSHSKTTEGLAAQLTAMHFKKMDAHQLIQSLQLSDSVKFAQYLPGPTQKEKDLQVIKQSIIAIEES